MHFAGRTVFGLTILRRGGGAGGESVVGLSVLSLSVVYHDVLHRAHRFYFNVYVLARYL